MLLSGEDKGYIAEILVEKIFSESGIKIFGLGVERAYQEFYQHAMHLKRCGVRTKEDDRVNHLFITPDFIILDKENRYEFIEVKYRTTRCPGNGDWCDICFSKMLDDRRIEKLNKSWRPYIVCVTSCLVYPSGNFSVISPPYVEDKRMVATRHLLNFNDWGIDREILEKYEKIAQSIFDETTLDSLQAILEKYGI